jgi:hypothetical protein
MRWRRLWAIDRQIIGAHCEPLLGGIEARPEHHRPALGNAIELEAQIEVHAPRIAPFENEVQIASAQAAAGGLCPGPVAGRLTWELGFECSLYHATRGSLLRLSLLHWP